MEPNNNMNDAQNGALGLTADAAKNGNGLDETMLQTQPIQGETAMEMQAAMVADQIANPAPAPKPEDNPMVEAAKAQKKAGGGKGALIAAVVFALIAVGGIGFGVWSFMDGQSQRGELDKQISSLKKQNNELLDQVAELNEKVENGTSSGGDTIIDIDTNTNIAYKNPIIKSDNTEVSYSLGLESSYILGLESPRRANISVVDGKISRCTLMERTSDTSWKVIDECSINGLDGSIYKVVEFGQGQANSDDMIGFIMESGKVAYFRLYDFASSSSVNIKGYLNIDKYVVDALTIGVGYNDGVGGYGSTVFVMSDGSFVKYDESMVE